ncbi:serine/threonine-protein phosphatase 2A 55 kDa regulatory subunit B [Pseudoscourfieldia marina]
MATTAIDVPTNAYTSSSPKMFSTGETPREKTTSKVDLGDFSVDSDYSDSSSSNPLCFTFSQCFGERSPGEEVHEADLISALEFSHDGEHLATGDRGGRVVLFERVDDDDAECAPNAACSPDDLANGKVRRRHGNKRRTEFRYSTEFQSHEPEFDFLKSLEIEEKINQIRWCNGTNNSHFLLSANDKTVKLWKVYEKKVRDVAEYNVRTSPSSSDSGPAYAPATAADTGMDGTSAASGMAPRCDYAAAEDLARRYGSGAAASLRLPRLRKPKGVLTARNRRVFSNAHAYHINSLSSNCDGETFLSSDDLRIILWNLEVAHQAFNIVDIKPTNMENLTEVITTTDFHPSSCSVFGYASSKGCIRLSDMRERALCDRHAKVFEASQGTGGSANGNGGTKAFFSEIIASITDMKFVGSGRFILSRDYMSLKLWDVAMDGRGPIATYWIHEHIRPRLGDLYESDNVFDKFECCASGGYHSPRTSPTDASSVIGTRYLCTGSYSNLFRVFDAKMALSGAPIEMAESSAAHQLLESSKQPNRYNGQYLSANGVSKLNAQASEKSLSGVPMDFQSKVLHLAWHPHRPVVAAAATNSLYLFAR